MESTFVVKVKYGDTLRRFSARVNGNGQLDLDMSGLRTKIIVLFNFPSESELTLTYVDEDGDVVSLVDDDELRDITRQSLKFLRIDVWLNSEISANSSARTSRSSTPIMSPKVQRPLPSINTAGFTEILKSVPEPLLEVLSKLSLDLASKAASTSPVLAEFVESLSKIRPSSLISDSEPQFDLNSRTQHGPSQSAVAPSASMEPASASDNGLVQVLPKTPYMDLSSENIPENVNRCMDSTITDAPKTVDLNLDPPSDLNLPGVAAADLGPSASYFSPVHDRNTAKEDRDNLGGKSVIVDESSCFADPVKSSYPCRRDNAGFGCHASEEGHSSGIPVTNNAAIPPYVCPRISSSRRSHIADAMGGMFHKGVRCDGCGVHPITGPRYKSKVKEDYDLCNICFSEMGHETEYYKIDRPVQHAYPRSLLKSIFPPNAWVGPRTMPHIGEFGAWANKPKLDSRFIQDVNVFDGTVMSPYTSFTKIWQMRNCGTLVWPQGTQLLWIGGDRFSGAVRVELEIPAGGVPRDGELNVAVDFTAPQLPGRYISYWRMASPSGVKFGQRVWVLIQVKNTRQDLVSGDLLSDGIPEISLNLNESPISVMPNDFGGINITPWPTVDHLSRECNRSSKRFTQPTKSADDGQPKEEKPNFIENGCMPDGYPFTPQQAPASSSASYAMPDYPSAPQQAPSFSSVSYAMPDYPLAPQQGPSSSSVSHPISDLQEKAPAETSLPSPPVMGVPLSSDNDVEKALLNELEEMGFKEVDLNKEILRNNGYNFELSVDALCGVSEWDPILEELQEMGFCDEKINKMLLKKNNGSIKAVVMDLLAAKKLD